MTENGRDPLLVDDWVADPWDDVQVVPVGPTTFRVTRRYVPQWAIIVGIVGFHFSPSVWPFVEIATESTDYMCRCIHIHLELLAMIDLCSREWRGVATHARGVRDAFSHIRSTSHGGRWDTFSHVRPTIYSENDIAK